MLFKKMVPKVTCKTSLKKVSQSIEDLQKVKI